VAVRGLGLAGLHHAVLHQKHGLVALHLVLGYFDAVEGLGDVLGLVDLREEHGLDEHLTEAVDHWIVVPVT